MATITDTTTDANGNIIINVSSSADDAITLATAGTYSDKNIIFNIKTPQNSVQPDWNQNDDTQPDYVKNRPFYTGDPVENIFVEESTVSFANSGYGYQGQIQSTFIPAFGETYKVTWDGVDYECTCIDAGGSPALGDLNILFGESGTGEPFLIGAPNGAELHIITLDDSASHTFSVVSKESAAPVVKINPKYLPISFKPSGGQYLTFSSANNFNLSIKNLSKNWDGTLEYFTSDGTWTVWDGTQALVANANEGEYALYLRGIGNTVITGQTNHSQWVLTGTDIKCIGNIENLLDYATVKSGKHPNMSNYCYYCMFESCTNLTKAPDLPAETLTEYCYYYMFSNCTSLTQAPALPAITLASHCYYGMFEHCTSLTQAPALPADMLASHCYQGMFRYCGSLTQAPALPATVLEDSCYYDMFSYCGSLTQAPTLPATVLAKNCYLSMFFCCTNLTQIPALPAITLESGCYSSMFSDCSSLKLSSTKTDECTQEYRIPFSGNGTTASNALKDIFASTGGTFTGTPEINTTYYLSSDNMVVRETEIATLNGYVGSMINNAVPELDTTLSIAGKSADAKATGDAIRALSEEIVTTSESKVAAHNTGTDTHSDIRLLIQGLTDRLNALADSDDTTLDQLSEVVAYIKSNRSLIEAITTNKVSVADIVDNLTTNVSNKPLSAAQGVALKALIDGIVVPDKLPNPNALTFTGAVTSSYDGSEPVTVEIPQGEGSGAADYQARFDGEFLQIAYSYVAGGGATNSKEHYEHCAKNDYDAVKADLRLTSDNQLVCCHDAGITLNADGRIVSYDSSNSTAIHEMTKVQFMALEFNTMYDGARCHTCDLETFLRICKNAGKIAYITIRGEYVEATVAALVEAVQDASMVSRTIINSFTMDALTAVRAVEPDLYLSLVIDPFTESERTTALTYAQGKKACQICLYYSNGSHTLAEMAADSTITAWIRSCIAARIRLIGAQTEDAADTNTLLKLGFCGVQTRVSRLTNTSYDGLDISTLNITTTSTDDATTLTFSDTKGNQKTAEIPKLQPTDAQVQAGVASWMNTNAKPTVIWSKNLYNQDEAVNGYIASAGQINNSNDQWVTGFISVSPGDVLTISKAGALLNCYFRAAYTSNKTFISRESGNANSYTVPDNAAYVRLSFKNVVAGKTDQVMVCANNTNLAYEAYGSHIEGGLGEYLVLMSTNGKKWTLKVSDTGELSTEEIS